MTLTEILAIPHRIKYINNIGADLSMFDKALDCAIFNHTTELPEEMQDLFVLSYVKISSTEQRCIINWA
jgi:hypothetical protein